MEAKPFDDELSLDHPRDPSTREADADIREAEADAREAAADERERHDDARDRVLDRWEREIAARAAELYALDFVEEDGWAAARLQRERHREQLRAGAEARRDDAIERHIQRTERAARPDAPSDVVPSTAEPAAFVQLALAAQTDPPLEQVIDLILAVAVDTVPGCAAASLALEVNGRMQTAAATVPWAAELDAAQLELGCGPLPIALQGGVAVTSNLVADARWPLLTDMPQPNAARGVISFALVVSGTTAGVLSLYAAIGCTFADTDVRIADMLAAHATVMLGRTIERLAFEAQAEAWQRALASRDTIGQAKGILMQQRSMTSDDAFRLLRETSQHLNVKLRAVAEHVVTDRRLPDD